MGLDEGIDASAGDFGDIGHIHPTIDPQTDAVAAFLFIGIQLGASMAGLGQGTGYELLPTKTGIDTHQQDDIDLVHHVIEIVERSRRIEHQTGLAAVLADQRKAAINVLGSFRMNWPYRASSAPST